jgi:Na+/phosphate symporter
MAQNLMLVIGGLALFLYGIEIMSASLKTAAGSRLKIIIEKTTNQVWKGILVGIGLSALIQSSSAVTVIIIGLVSVDLMTLKQATAVVVAFVDTVGENPTVLQNAGALGVCSNGSLTQNYDDGGW